MEIVTRLIAIALALAVGVEEQCYSAKGSTHAFYSQAYTG